MTLDEFDAALHALGWKVSEFCRATACTATPSRWRNDGVEIPDWVPRHLGLLLDVKRLHAATCCLKVTRVLGGTCRICSVSTRLICAALWRIAVTQAFGRGHQVHALRLRGLCAPAPAGRPGVRSIWLDAPLGPLRKLRGGLRVAFVLRRRSCRWSMLGRAQDWRPCVLVSAWPGPRAMATGLSAFSPVSEVGVACFALVFGFFAALDLGLRLLKACSAALASARSAPTRGETIARARLVRRWVVGSFLQIHHLRGRLPHAAAQLCSLLFHA